ncbi:MAG: hypothetical protein AVDCRST_MAG68-5643, partial [uncultured Gemmatimonadetes bacterium]
CAAVVRRDGLIAVVAVYSPRGLDATHRALFAAEPAHRERPAARPTRLRGGAKWVRAYVAAEAAAAAALAQTLRRTH